MMEYADYLALFSVLLIALFNRQAILFLIAFALCEAIFLLPIDGFVYSIVISVLFSLIFIFSGLKLPLKVAVVCYSLMYWLSAVDFYVTIDETYFSFVFPYVIKMIDLFVIFYLIANRERVDAGSYRNAYSNHGNWH